MTTQTRLEADALGEQALPADVLYGINTARALNNFPFKAPRLGEEPDLVTAFAQIKKASALANTALNTLGTDVCDAICLASDEMADGRLSAWLQVNLMEGSGGTSLNMNVNEVLANRALQILGYSPGDYHRVNPNDHINRSQSTNDVVPSAIRIACYQLLHQTVSALDHLADICEQKRDEYAHTLKLGRTCLQDAQPMTLGQAFGGYEAFARRSAAALKAQQHHLLSLPLSATAVGTGFGSPPGYREKVYETLAQVTGLPVTPAYDLFDAMSNADELVRLSGDLLATATGMGKIANDLILLSSGPRGGLAELHLPAVQGGSSIMPGKVNPVIPISIRQIAFAVTGYHAMVTAASGDGMLEINHYEPVTALALFASLRLVTTGALQFADYCIDGLFPDEARMRETLFASSAIATGFTDRMGYGEVSKLVGLAHQEGLSFLEYLRTHNIMPDSDMEELIRRSTIRNSLA